MSAARSVQPSRLAAGGNELGALKNDDARRLKDSERGERDLVAARLADAELQKAGMEEIARCDLIPVRSRSAVRHLISTSDSASGRVSRGAANAAQAVDQGPPTVGFRSADHGAPAPSAGGSTNKAATDPSRGGRTHRHVPDLNGLFRVER
jgi:hypothetical protein